MSLRGRSCSCPPDPVYGQGTFLHRSRVKSLACEGRMAADWAGVFCRRTAAARTHHAAADAPGIAQVAGLVLLARPPPVLLNAAGQVAGGLLEVVAAPERPKRTTRPSSRPRQRRPSAA